MHESMPNDASMSRSFIRRYDRDLRQDEAELSLSFKKPDRMAMRLIHGDQLALLLLAALFQ